MYNWLFNIYKDESVCWLLMNRCLLTAKLIHFQSKNNMKLRYVLTVVITTHIFINNEIYNWLNHVFMSLLSPLAEPPDNESETDGHLTRMGPRLIMNICPIFYGPAFSQCQLAKVIWIMITQSHMYTIKLFVLKPVLARSSMEADSWK